MHERIKKLSEEVIHENPWWTYKHDTFERPDGAVGDYYYGVERGMSMAIAMLDSGKIVLALQHRYLEDRQSIEFPAGGIDEGETAREAAARELAEETGCVGKDFIFLGGYQSYNGFFKAPAHVFLCSVSERLAQKQETTEAIEILERTPEEFDEMVKKNEIWDGQTLAAWALARHHFIA